MDNLGTIAVVLCGGVVACGALLMLMAVFLLRFAGPSLSVPLLSSVMNSFLGRQAQQENLSEDVYASRRKARPSSEDLRAKAQSLDFDAAVARQQGNFNAESAPSSAPPPVPGQPPLRPPASGLGQDRFGSPSSGIPPRTPPTPSGGRPLIPGQTTPPPAPPGRRKLRPTGPDPFDTSNQPTPDDPMDTSAPSLRSQRRRSSTTRGGDNAQEDELFGGLLDDDGDGFAEL